MNDVKRYLVTSVSEYVKCVKKINQKENAPLWYRGHSKSSYLLLPGILRSPFIYHDSKEMPFTPKQGEIVQLSRGGYKGFSTRRLLDAFKINYNKQKVIHYHPKDDFEWLCLMQHYGIPTRLLDWSTNAFTALYFALHGKHSKSRINIKFKKSETPNLSTEGYFEGAVVYIINPSEINANTLDTTTNIPFAAVMNLSKRQDFIPSAIFPNDHEESFCHFVACVSSKKFDFRILTQQGVFMLFGKMNFHLEYIEHLRPLIHKIFIPKQVLGEMYSDLNNLGFNTKTIYPDTDPNAIIAKNRLKKSIDKLLETEEEFVKKILKI